MPGTLEYVGDGDWDRVRLNTDRTAQALNPPVPQARVYNNANLTIPNNTFTALTFNSERYDSGGLHSTSVNTGRLTAPITGLYSIGASIAFASNAVGYREMFIQYNGGSAIDDITANAVNGSRTSMTLPTEYQMAAGDYVTVVVLQTSGGNLDISSSTNFSPEFWMHRVAGYVNQGV